MRRGKESSVLHRLPLGSVVHRPSLATQQVSSPSLLPARHKFGGLAATMDPEGLDDRLCFCDSLSGKRADISAGVSQPPSKPYDTPSLWSQEFMSSGLCCVILQGLSVHCEQNHCAISTQAVNPRPCPRGPKTAGPVLSGGNSLWMAGLGNLSFATHQSCDLQVTELPFLHVVDWVHNIRAVYVMQLQLENAKAPSTVFGTQ